jgi:Trp operon repressor
MTSKDIRSLIPDANTLSEQTYARVRGPIMDDMLKQLHAQMQVASDLGRFATSITFPSYELEIEKEVRDFFKSKGYAVWERHEKESGGTDPTYSTILWIGWDAETLDEMREEQQDDDDE